MERRALLRSGALSVTLALLPPFLRRAFSADMCETQSALVVREAFDRARRRGLPVLVFVAPTDALQRSTQGGLFGELIDLGPATALGTLALAEVVCASLAAVRCVDPATPEATGNTPMFLIVDTTPDATVTALHVHVPPWRASEKPLTPSEEIASWTRQTRTHIARMTSALRRELAGPALLRRARQNFAVLDGDDRKRIVAAAHDGGAALPLDLVERGAPTLLASALATHQGEARRAAFARLAAVGRRRLRERSPAGGRWLRLGGCTEYARHNPDDQVGDIGCGLSSIRVLSARFLNFHTAVER